MKIESKSIEAELERYSTEDLVTHFDALVKLISKRQKEKFDWDYAVTMAQLDLDDVIGSVTGESK